MNAKKFKIRVLSSDCKNEVFEYCCTYSEAVSRFLFYVHCALELGVSIRCVNVFVGKKCIKLFQNR